MENVMDKAVTEFEASFEPVTTNETELVGDARFQPINSEGVVIPVSKPEEAPTDETAEEPVAEEPVAEEPVEGTTKEVVEEVPTEEPVDIVAEEGTIEEAPAEETVEEPVNETSVKTEESEEASETVEEPIVESKEEPADESAVEDETSEEPVAEMPVEEPMKVEDTEAEASTEVTEEVPTETKDEATVEPADFGVTTTEKVKEADEPVKAGGTKEEAEDVNEDAEEPTASVEEAETGVNEAVETTEEPVEDTANLTPVVFDNVPKTEEPVAESTETKSEVVIPTSDTQVNDMNILKASGITFEKFNKLSAEKQQEFMRLFVEAEDNSGLDKRQLHIISKYKGYEDDIKAIVTPDMSEVEIIFFANCIIGGKDPHKYKGVRGIQALKFLDSMYQEGLNFRQDTIALVKNVLNRDIDFGVLSLFCDRADDTIVDEYIELTDKFKSYSIALLFMELCDKAELTPSQAFNMYGNEDYSIIMALDACNRVGTVNYFAVPTENGYNLIAD